MKKRRKKETVKHDTLGKSTRPMKWIGQITGQEQGGHDEFKIMRIEGDGYRMDHYLVMCAI